MAASFDCPNPLARAPLATRDGGVPASRLYLAPPALQGAIVAILCRDTRGFTLTDAQRLTHFPASPMVSLSWYQGCNGGLVERTESGAQWRSFGAEAVLSGSQSQPTVSWAPTTGRGGMVCFTADVAQTLFGIDMTTAADRFVDADAALGKTWRPLLDALLDTQDDAAALAVLEQHLAPRWHAIAGQGAVMSTLRRAGRHWVERLAWQAHEWRRTHSPRQVERRIKTFSGRSLREWQTLVKTEGVYFAAMDRYQAGQPFDWAALAQEEGFADQAHLSRTVKRITGFSPGEFAERFVEDEAFWAYRLWV